MNVRNNPNDPDRKKMLDKVEAVIRKYAVTAPGGYIQRMKQVESFSIDRANGDVWKKDALKKQLMAETGGQCIDCKREFKATSLQMHRIDPTYRHDEQKNCGYFRENVRLVCA